MISQPSWTRPWAKGTIPRLSLTEINARGMSSRSGVEGGSPGGEVEDHTWEQLVFFGEHAGRERLGGVVRQYRDSGLGEDLAPVVLLVHQVDGAAALGDDGRQHRCVDPLDVQAGAAEGGEEGAVDVRGPPPVPGRQFAGNALEVAGEDDEIDHVRHEEGEPLGS